MSHRQLMCINSLNPSSVNVWSAHNHRAKAERMMSKLMRKKWGSGKKRLKTQFRLHSIDSLHCQRWRCAAAAVLRAMIRRSSNFILHLCSCNSISENLISNNFMVCYCGMVAPPPHVATLSPPHHRAQPLLVCPQQSPSLDVPLSNKNKMHASGKWDGKY